MANEPKRILQVVTYMGRGGIETVLMNYYRHIDRSRVQFDFLVHRDFPGEFDDEIEALGGRIWRVPPLNSLKISYHKALGAFFRTHPYRTVHCHLNYKSGVVLAAAKRAGVPVRIAHAHTAGMPAGLPGLVRRLMKPLIPLTATHCLACGRAAGAAVFGLRPYGILPNAVDGAALRYDEVLRRNMRKTLNLGDDFTLIHVGRFGEEKNHSFLLDVFAQVLKRAPEAKLLLAGDGGLRKAMEEKTAALPEGAVRFLGIRADIPALLQAADVFVLPSVFEGMPVTLIEAQAAGLPCVKSDSVTSECVLTELVTSLPITDPALWAEEILKKRGIPRTDRLAQIMSGGYDITAESETLTRFYLDGESL